MARIGLNIPITADSKGVKQGTKEAETALDKFHAKATGQFHEAKHSALGFATGLIGGAGVVEALKSTVEAANANEVAQRRLQAQLDAQGQSWEGNREEIEKTIKATSALSGLTDVDLTGAFTNLVRATGNVRQSMGLLTTAADIARAKNIDVAKAAQLLGRVAQGSTGALSRYGVTIDKNATAQQALAAVQQKFAGQAKAYGETTAGALDRVHASSERLQEVVGSRLAPHLADAASHLADFLDQMSSGKGAGGDFARTMGDIVRPLGTIVGFLKDHPRLLEEAAGAWAVYKAASLAALAAIKVQTFRQAFAKTVPVAGEEGAAAGAAYAAGFDTTGGAAVGKLGSGGRLLRAFKGLGVVLGGALAVEAASQVRDVFDPGNKDFSDTLNKLHNQINATVKDAYSQIGRGGAGLSSSGSGLGGLPGSSRVPRAPRLPPPRPAGRVPGGGIAHTSAVASAASVGAHASGGTYSHDQLASLWVQAGGPSSVADMAAAIALAESGGNASVVNSIGATGLWQIHPGGSQYLEPMANARAAVAKYRGAGNTFRPWTTYTGYDTPGHVPTYTQFLTGSAGSTGGAAAPSGASSGTGAHHAAPRPLVGTIGQPASHGRGRGAPSASPTARLGSLAYIEEAVALAALTGPATDDIRAAQALVAYWRKRLRRAKKAHNTKAITEAAQNLASAQGALAGIDLSGPGSVDVALPPDDTGQSAADALAANTAALQALNDQVKRGNDLTEQVGKSDTAILKRALADAVSGSIGGPVFRGLGVPAFAGNRMAY